MYIDGFMFIILFGRERDRAERGERKRGEQSGKRRKKRADTRRGEGHNEY